MAPTERVVSSHAPEVPEMPEVITRPEVNSTPTPTGPTSGESSDKDSPKAGKRLRWAKRMILGDNDGRPGPKTEGGRR